MRKTERKSFYITTLGCPKNIADSIHMEESLISEGLVKSDDADKSHFHLINTCTFIKSATEETIETILDAANIKKKNQQKLVVVGCFAERFSEAIQTEMKEVDLCFGTGKYKQAGNIIKEHFPEEFADFGNFDSELAKRELFSSLTNSKPYSFVKVSDGCNRGCYFCIIPNLRGNFKDYPEEKVIEDAQNAIVRGAKEICIVSQDTVFYAKDTDKLKSLIQKISEIDGIKIIRLLYLYPDKKTEKLLTVFRDIPKVAPYLESPIQHASEKVLKSMNRTGSYSFFKDLFQKAREMRPGLEIRTSFILGYPGETPDDVEDLLKFVEEVRPENLALFAYSPEEETVAGALKQDVSKKESARRVNLVREVHLKVLKEIQASRVGKIFDAIVDETGEETIARRFQDAPEIDGVVYVHNDKKLKPGTIGKVRIDSFIEYDMEGTWI